jgi:glycosyltransferase involved in cell wall biosynthesis
MSGAFNSTAMCGVGRKKGDFCSMQILFVSTTSFISHTHLLSFAKHLREKGHQAAFACSPWDYEDAPVRVKELREEGFDVYEIPLDRSIQLWKDAKALWSLTNLLRNKKFDLVHICTSKAGFVGRFAAKFVGCPMIVHMPYDFFFRAYPSGLKRWFFVLLEKLVAPFCDVMLFISDAVHQDCLAYRMKHESTLIKVGYGIDMSRHIGFQADVKAVRSQYGIGENDLVVGNIGRQVYHKGTDTLIRAAAIVLQKFPQARFIIAGDGSSRPDYEELAKSLGITANVHFVGFLPTREDVMQLMKAVDIFVLPTRREGLGVVYIEAMALQCAVIGSRIAPVTEIIRDGETGLLATVDDPEDFAHAIVTLLEDSTLRQKIGIAGHDQVIREFDEKDIFERIEDVYHKLALANGIEAKL